jgi:hypothetical protein
MHVAYWDGQHLQTQGNARIPTQMGDDCCKMASCGRATDRQSIWVQVEFDCLLPTDLQI